MSDYWMSLVWLSRDSGNGCLFRNQKLCIFVHKYYYWIFCMHLSEGGGHLEGGKKRMLH